MEGIQLHEPQLDVFCIDVRCTDCTEHAIFEEMLTTFIQAMKRFANLLAAYLTKSSNYFVAIIAIHRTGEVLH